MLTVFHGGCHIVEGLQQNRLVNGVGEPRVDEGFRVEGSIHTNAAAGLDTVGQVESDCKDLARVVRNRGVDGRRARADSSLRLCPYQTSHF